MLHRTLVVLAIVCFSSASAWGADKTDVVTLVNGDRITGDVEEMTRGRLTIETADAGTIEIEWEKVASVVAGGRFEVGTSDGRRFLGTLNRTVDRFVLVAAVDGNQSLTMAEVTSIMPIGASFWTKLDGALDAGFSYTRSSGVSQMTMNSKTAYRALTYLVELHAAGSWTHQGEEDRTTDQAIAELGYVRYHGLRWFTGGEISLATNASMGLVLRTQGAGVAGYRLVNSNRARAELGGGLVANNEQGVDTEASQNIEGQIAFKSSYYTYDSPKTVLDASVKYYPSFSSWGRQRLQIDASVKRELWKNFNVGLTMFDTFDTDPPNPDAARNDVGVTVTIGWTYGR